MIALIVVCIATFISESSYQAAAQTYSQFAPIRGSTDKASKNSFACPGNGAIIGIKYEYNKLIRGLVFICSSKDGIRSFGAYGNVDKDDHKELNCPERQYISSISGIYGDKFVYSLRVRCRNVTDGLKGNGEDPGIMIGEIRNGLAFDDLTYSDGGRPVGLTIWNADDYVTAIQVDYSDTPVELCAGNCTDYQEEFTDIYGEEYDGYQLAVLYCPANGAITALTTKVSGGYVRTIQFSCTSGLGTVQLPAIGQPMDTSKTGVTTVKCPPGEIVGSFHGRQSGENIPALGVRCVALNETGLSPKYDAQGGTSGVAFDDEKYSQKGWRPVLVRLVYDSTRIKAIQIIYGNSDVSTNCKVTHIEVTDGTVQATSDGFEIIGAETGITCSEDIELLTMDYSRDVTEEVTIEVAEGGDLNWAAEVSVGASVGFEVFGNGVEVSVSASASVGGSKQWSSSKSNTTGTTTGQYAGAEIKYDGPGACIVIGYVDRYKIDRDEINVKYHYTCESGDASYTLGTIRLQSKTYGKAYFENYAKKFSSAEQCANSTACIRNLNVNNVLADTSSVIAQFDKCFL